MEFEEIRNVLFVGGILLVANIVMYVIRRIARGRTRKKASKRIIRAADPWKVVDYDDYYDD